MREGQEVTRFGQSGYSTHWANTLGKVFRKLDITSRVQLARVLTNRDGDAPVG